jgi:thiol-disulfide isomerase/thioredoxin
MRGALKIAMLLVLCALMAWLVYRISVKTERINNTRNQRQTLPSAIFTELGGGTYTVGTTRHDSLILVYFNPDCGHCRDFGTAVNQLANRFENHFFVWVSPSPDSLIGIYQTELLPNLPNSILLRDTANAFYQAFGYQTVPSVLVYHHRQLFAAYQGDVKPDLLLPHHGKK